MQIFHNTYIWIGSAYQHFVKELTLLLEGKNAKSTIASLDGVRAIACLLVVGYHLTLVMVQDVHRWSPQQLSPLVASLLYFGDTGVNLFFILSGFLLFMPYAKALLFENAWPSIRNFYIRRALRILPAYYVSLFLMILLFRPDFLHINRLGDLCMFLILFMDSSPTAFKQINGPFWTLAVEWQFYLLLPFLALGIAWLVRLVSKTPPLRFLALIVCLSLVMSWGIFTRYAGVNLTVPSTTTYQQPFPIQLFLFFCYGVPNAGLHGKFLEDFALGMLVSSCFVYAHEVGTDSALRRLLQRFSPLLFTAGLILLLVMEVWKYDLLRPHTWPFFDDKLTLYRYLGEFGWGLGYALCVTAILFGASWLQRPFTWTPLRWIGLLSYGLYMWHF